MGGRGPRLRSLQHLPDPLARLRALLLKGREGKGMEGGVERNWYRPTFWGKVTPCDQQTVHVTCVNTAFDTVTANHNP